MSKAYDISAYSFTSSDALILDTNVWFCLYYSFDPAPDWVVKRYSAAYKRMLTVGVNLFVNLQIISEFINRYARLEHMRLRPSETARQYKAFRDSADFLPVAQDIAIATREILQQCQRIDDGFAACNVDAMINDFETGATDFNDQIIVNICQAGGYRLVTNDRDFKCYIPIIDILSANRHLFVP